MNFDYICGIIVRVLASSALNRGFYFSRVKPKTIKLVRVMVFNATYIILSQYFSYILVVSFIGEGNRRKPPTCRSSLTNFITQYCIEYTSP